MSLPAHALPTFEAALSFYDGALAAVAKALSHDDIEEISSRAEAIRAYARVAKNIEMEIQATEIRLRARRRLGQMLMAVISDGTVEPNPDPPNKPLSYSKRKKLFATLGVNTRLGDIALKAAAPSDQQYENLIASWRTRCREKSATTLTLEPPEPRAPYSPEPPPPPRLPCAYDDYYLETQGGPYAGAYGECIGDLHVENIEHEIRELLTEKVKSALSFDQDVHILRAVQRHFGGGFTPRQDGIPILLRDVISAEKLQSFIDRAKAAMDRKALRLNEDERQE